ncbi:MAG: hypothetical protein KFB93_01400 [Simkaniaceae bacterium]|nr:MAG: hypothetical protein KFB93_01400 [Simkaniaceae bacterium]
MPSLPPRPVALPPKPTFGERLQGVVRELFDHGLPNSAPLIPRTQVMIFPQEPSTPQNSLPGFTPNLQTRYPEAYALARQVDQFGKEQVALFRVTLENHQRRPHPFREFDALPTLLERATGHSLNTPGLTPERPSPLSLRVETLAVATLQNPRVQGSLQVIGGACETIVGAGITLASEGIAAPAGWVIMTHGLDHLITGTEVILSGRAKETVTVQVLQQMGLTQEASNVADGILSIASGANASRMTLSRGLLNVEEVAARSTVAYRTGFVSEKTVAKLSGKTINRSLPIEQGGRRIGNFRYTEGSFKHFYEVSKRGVNKGQLERPYMRSLHTIRQIMIAKKPIPDPQAFGAIRWDVPGTFNGSNGMWELVFHPETNSIYHFQFKSFKKI